MRNFSKTLISMAAVMAVGSAMAAGAMAGELTVSTKDAEGKDTLANGTVTISDVTPGMSQYTLLVVEGVEVTVDDKKEIKYDANEDTIVQIDQNDDGTPFSTIVVGTDLTKGATYQVRVGNNKGEVDEGYFTVGGGVEYVDYLVGNVDGNTRVNAKDTLYVLRYATYKEADKNSDSTKYTANVGDTLKLSNNTDLIVGNVDGNTRVNAKDTLYVLRYATYKEADKNSDSTKYTANVGDTVQVIK